MVREKHEEHEDVPFSNYIMNVPLPQGFKHPTDMEPYDGTIDPQDHLDSFKSRMCLDEVSDPVKFQAFPTTLKKVALKWFNSLPLRSVTRFLDLSSKFLSHFTIRKFKLKSIASLLGLYQQPNESMRSYLERFNAKCLLVEDL